MIRAGKVLYLGIWDTPAWIISAANVLAELKGWTPFAGLQIQYSLALTRISQMATQFDDPSG